MVQVERLKALLEPILEVKLLIAPPFTFNEFTLANRLDTQLEDGGSVRHESGPVPVRHLRALADGVQTVDMSLDLICSNLQQSHGTSNGVGC